MQIVATIKKLLRVYPPDELLGHIANELEQEAAHYETVGAPMKAKYTRALVAELRMSAERLEDIQY
jgi:hypothetical protein